MSWNSIIVPYDSNRKIAAKTLVNQRGDTISIFSGSFLLQSVICDIKKDIDKVASEVKSFDDYKPIQERYDPLHGGIRGSGYLINKAWKQLKTKFGLRLQEIADEIEKPLRCFLCPSIDVLTIIFALF